MWNGFNFERREVEDKPGPAAENGHRHRGNCRLSTDWLVLIELKFDPRRTHESQSMVRITWLYTQIKN